MSDAIYGRTFLSGRMSIAVSRLARIWKVFPGGINISMWHHLQLPQHAAAFINNLNFGGVSLANKTLEYFAWCRVGLRILQLAGSSQRQQKSYACAKWPKLWPPDGKPASRPTDRPTDRHAKKVQIKQNAIALRTQFWLAVLSARAWHIKAGGWVASTQLAASRLRLKWGTKVQWDLAILFKRK